MIDGATGGDPLGSVPRQVRSPAELARAGQQAKQNLARFVSARQTKRGRAEEGPELHVRTRAEILAARREEAKKERAAAGIAVNETPVVMNETPVAVNETPVAVNETPVAMNETPVAPSQRTEQTQEEKEEKEEKEEVNQVKENNNNNNEEEGENDNDNEEEEEEEEDEEDQTADSDGDVERVD